MLMRSLVVVGLVGLASLVANIALADDAASPVSFVAVNGVNLSESGTRADGTTPLRIVVRESGGSRFAELAPYDTRQNNPSDTRGYELALSADGQVAGLPVGVSIAQRASIGDDGDNIAREGRGAELRLGRGVNMARWETPSWDKPAWYMFIAADDEAITFRPGARSSFGGAAPSFALQDRVEIGDLQAGITFEAGGLQASLAYVEREIEARSGARTYSQDENFAGLTVTMRR